MDYQSYEDYMKQILGYSSYNPNIYETYDYKASKPYTNTYYRNDSTFNLPNDNIDGLYPEIYNLINPIVCKVCSNNTEYINKELLEKMTDEVYNLVEGNNNIVNVRIESKKDESNNTSAIKNTERIARRKEPINNANVEKVTRRDNQTLRDLIKILILKQLLADGNRPTTRPPRPNYLPYPGANNMMPRPPYLGEIERENGI